MSDPKFQIVIESNQQDAQKVDITVFCDVPDVDPTKFVGTKTGDALQTVLKTLMDMRSGS